MRENSQREEGETNCQNNGKDRMNTREELEGEEEKNKKQCPGLHCYISRGLLLHGAIITGTQTQCQACSNFDYIRNMSKVAEEQTKICIKHINAKGIEDLQNHYLYSTRGLVSVNNIIRNINCILSTEEGNAWTNIRKGGKRNQYPAKILKATRHTAKTLGINLSMPHGGVDAAMDAQELDSVRKLASNFCGCIHTGTRRSSIGNKRCICKTCKHYKNIMGESNNMEKCSTCGQMNELAKEFRNGVCPIFQMLWLIRHHPMESRISSLMAACKRRKVYK